MSIRLIVYLVVLVYGVWYTLNPMRSLKRKFRDDEEVPKVTIAAARVIGVIIILIGVIGALYDIYRMVSG